MLTHAALILALKSHCPEFIQDDIVRTISQTADETRVEAFLALNGRQVLTTIAIDTDGDQVTAVKDQWGVCD